MKRWSALLLNITILGNLGCTDMLSTPSIPDGTQSPSTWKSRQGAMALTRAAVNMFRSTAWEFTVNTGLLTDELSSLESSNQDMRYFPEQKDPNLAALYKTIHELRGQSRIARGALAEYASDLSPAVTGQLFSFEGYAEIWLADLFCSGVPLSTLEYNADFTLRPPSTTTEVYEHAITLFDSALALVVDSPALKTLATIGKGRALLSLGRFDEAASVVQGVEVNDVYRIRIRVGAPLESRSFAIRATVSDNEGENGLPYRSSGDPRTLSIEVPTTTRLSSLGVVVYQPVKYDYYDSTWFSVASGIEAELIRSEAALRQEQHSVWLSILNALRTTGTYSSIDGADTLWDAGSGGIARLGPLQDPGDADARINLLFRERAAWLFVTGQRQADLRRLIRTYQRQRETVYPTGLYSTQLVNNNERYGDDITAPIPVEELGNHYYHGCLSRD